MVNVLESIACPCTSCRLTHAIEPTQFPPGVLERLKFEHGHIRWTGELFAWLKEHPAAPDDYPGARLSLSDAIFMALPAAPYLLGGACAERVLVAGSMSPWIECLILDLYPHCIITVTDHNPIMIEHDRVRYAPPRTAYERRYDLVVSYSSVEHFGLGRYGDPLNADADLEWMQTIKRCIAPVGRLILAVPQGPEDKAEDCWHRIYGPGRLSKLLEGWNVIKSIASPYSQFDWQNQPVLTLVPQ